MAVEASLPRSAAASGARKNDPLPMLPERPSPDARAAGASASRADDPWDIPEPLVSKIDPMPYPIDALPGAVCAAVEEAEAHIMAPAALIADVR